jgi:hypothetical protein
MNKPCTCGHLCSISMRELSNILLCILYSLKIVVYLEFSLMVSGEKYLEKYINKNHIRLESILLMTDMLVLLPQHFPLVT